MLYHPRKRAGLPKSHSGCTTCKTRHVKCDEARPSCVRCQKLSLECLYNAKPAKLPRHTRLSKDTATRQPIKPIVRTSTSIAATHLQPDTMSIPVKRISHLFADDQEYRCFRLFHESTSRDISGCFTSKLWSRTVLQACENEPSLRHAVIAVGALDLANRTFQRSHHEFALRQYGKAIKQMEEFLSLEGPNIRTAIIFCLLIVCFESWNGNIQGAMDQVRIGLRLIHDWQKGWSKIDSDKSELALAFTQLDNDTLLFIDKKPITLEGTFDRQIPATFDTTEEARFHFETLLQSFSHWVAEVYAWGSQSKEAKYRRQGSSQQRDSSFESKEQGYLNNFRKWYEAFQPLLTERNESHPEYMATLALKLRWKSVYISVSCNHFQGEANYEAHNSDFREVIDLSERILTLSSKKVMPKFTFDGSVIISIYVVVLKCRDPVIRRQGISLLRSRTMREGTMDSVLRARIAEIQMEIEEAGAINGYIPEEARIRGIKANYNMEERTGTMRYLKLTGRGTKTFQMHSLPFSW